MAVYRENSTVPDLKAIYEKETWETVNRHNASVRFIKSWELTKGFQAYLDRFSDPDDDFSKAGCINAIKDITTAVGDAIGKTRGAPESDDLASKVIYWEIVKAALPTVGDGNDPNLMANTAIKSAMADVGVDVAIQSPPLLVEMWQKRKGPALRFSQDHADVRHVGIQNRRHGCQPP